MKKILPLALSMFVVMLMAAWSISWYVQARDIRNYITTQMKLLDPAIGNMNAAAVTTSGFPFRMLVTIQNPSVTLHTKQAMAILDKYTAVKAGNSAAALTTPEYPEATLSYQLQGTLSVALNMLSDKIRIEYSGSDTVELVQKEATTTLAIDYNGLNRCDAKLKRGFANLLQQTWDVKPFLTPENFAAELTEFACEFPGSITMNMANNQLVSSLGALKFILVNQPVGDMSHNRFTMDLKDYEVMPAGDEVMNRIRRIVVPANQTVAPVSMSLYGKQSASLEVASELPQNFSSLKDKPFRIEVSRFNFVNAASTTNGTARVTSAITGTQQQGDVALNITSEFNPRQADISRANIGQFLQEVVKDPRFDTNTMHADQKKVEAALFDALPNVTQLGKLTQNIAFHYTLERTERAGSIDISALEISSRDYGVNAKGTASLSPSQMLPTAEMTLTCRNCMAMLDTLSGYLARLQVAATLMSPKNEGQIALAPGEAQSIKQLLVMVGKPAVTSPNDLEFAISSNNGAVNINGKSLGELMGLAQQTMGSAPTEPVSVK